MGGEENYDGSGAWEYMDNETYQAKADVNTISSISYTLYDTSFIVMSTLWLNLSVSFRFPMQPGLLSARKD